MFLLIQAFSLQLLITYLFAVSHAWN